MEPAEDKALAASIIAVTNHLKELVDNGDIDPDNYTVDQLLALFQSQDIVLNTEDLYTMLDEPLLSSVISNIQGDKIVFKGDETVTINPGQEKEPDNQKVVANMANSAMKSRPDLPGGISVS